MALRRLLRILFRQAAPPVPAEVAKRLRQHAAERDARMVRYAATWQRNWNREAEARRFRMMRVQ